MRAWAAMNRMAASMSISVTAPRQESNLRHYV